MPNRSEIQAQIDALTEQLNSADDDDGYEVEIFKDGKGARVPMKHARGWLERELGIDFSPPRPAAGAGDGADPGGGAPAGGAGTGRPAARVRQRKTGGGDGGQGDGLGQYFPGARKS